VHLLRRDTFDQAVSLVRAEVTGVWKITAQSPPAARLDLLALADRIEAAAEQLHRHKAVSAAAARRYGAMLVDYEEYTRDERSYDGIQQFLRVRSRVPLRHVNIKNPPIDAEVYRSLRDELERRRAPMFFHPEAT
jgi:hypothetical protein